MTKNLARKCAIDRSIFVYRGRSSARDTAIKRNLSEGRNYLSQGNKCNLADHVGADRQNRPGNRLPKRGIRRAMGNILNLRSVT